LVLKPTTLCTLSRVEGVLFVVKLKPKASTWIMTTKAARLGGCYATTAIEVWGYSRIAPRYFAMQQSTLS
jgi:hypothetical protein